MYSAIVFLPLIGAIIAGAISIFGAHERTQPGRRSMVTAIAPGRGPMAAESENGADDHGHGTTTNPPRPARVRRRSSPPAC